MTGDGVDPDQRSRCRQPIVSCSAFRVGGARRWARGAPIFSAGARGAGAPGASPLSAVALAERAIPGWAPGRRGRRGGTGAPGASGVLARAATWGRRPAPSYALKKKK